MNRREFFRRSVGVAVGAAVAPHVSAAADLSAPLPACGHHDYSVSFVQTLDEGEVLAKYAKWLGEGSRRITEQEAARIFMASL